MRPAACQVVPDVRRSRSSSTTSRQPRCPRWYATDAPITPPPTTTTRARDGTTGSLIVATLGEHHRLVAVDEDAMFEVSAYRPRQHDPFEVAALAQQVVDRVAVRDAGDVLVDDRALV